ncbi:bifunctional phosphopantothenoylcysteine decarboxylase/phosphopantothenate--cysteine ligase CoaBC [Arthrobacter roseus]|uniref:bifunctional phosphopantothenoylcysteine decarboxylase/phosphopantothenate--cysteine ligase CoaBC n=1 Tax=Arthrobacter roseus TaxID=136274 RepID=UPI001962CD94|nr:bifunctional phosphopantothenoylcysteine decarboxylase/phosphopantothenate--cysteine ligase CoaBC [Arthrobacter roseus]MBM7848629.1 phosphopantothenoylcysteine decarboxylase/phosphopantothenate--cysteine ligase [Arthrobacter roseus]
MRIVLGVGGGIAAFKAVSLLRLLTEAGHDVTVVPTETATRFVGTATWEALSGKTVTNNVFDAVPQVNHVRLGQEADLVVVAPATADLLAKAAGGFAGDLLTTTLLMAGSPVCYVPAMHTEMWQHPATVRNVEILRDRGNIVLEPDSGRLTGPDSGPGRLPEPSSIVESLQPLLERGRHLSCLSGKRVIITVGGTREPLDPVRFLGNRSSGKQGMALARSAIEAGAVVQVIAANTEVRVPRGAEVLEVETTAEMQQAVMEQLPLADVVIMAAAVADFRPAEVAGSKIKKRDGYADPVLELVRNPDILRELVEHRERSGQKVLIAGFAAETGDDQTDALTYAREKLRRKGCDLLVLNDVSGGNVFGEDSTTVTILTAGTSETTSVAGTKENVANTIVTSIAALME